MANDQQAAEAEAFGLFSVRMEEATMRYNAAINRAFDEYSLAVALARQVYRQDSEAARQPYSLIMQTRQTWL